LTGRMRVRPPAGACMRAAHGTRLVLRFPHTS
jgi:hypothetical protein